MRTFGEVVLQAVYNSSKLCTCPGCRKRLPLSNFSIKGDDISETMDIVCPLCSATFTVNLIDCMLSAEQNADKEFK